VIANAPPSGGHRTIDRPFARTFDPSDAPGALRRKKSVLLGVAGLALSLAILLVAMGGKKSRATAGQGTVQAQAAGAFDGTSQAGALAAAAPSEEPPAAEAPLAGDETEARPPAAHDVAAHGPATSSSSAPAAQTPARRKAKAAKGTGGKHDYGI
jgi:hypothetical protein